MQNLYQQLIKFDLANLTWNNHLTTKQVMLSHALHDKKVSWVNNYKDNNLSSHKLVFIDNIYKFN